MRDAVIWTGPVNFKQAGPDATLPDAYEINVGCHGDRPPHCPTLPSRLAAVLGRRNLMVDDVRDVVIGAFSAGGSLVKRMLMHEPDRKRVTAVHLADATYTAAWKDKARRIPPPIEGFVRYALDAIDGPHMLVATASPSPNGPWSTGVENLQSMRAEIEARSGRQFEELTNFYDIDPQPDHAYKLGNVILAEYPMKPLGHGHVSIAGQVWNNIIKPWLATSRDQPVTPPVEPGQPPTVPSTPAPSRGMSAGSIALFGVATLAGYAAVRWLSARRA